MARAIRWTKEAEVTYFNVIEYLSYNWTDKQVKSFIDSTYQVLDLIAENPQLSRSSGIINVREVLVTKHNLLIYKIYKKEIVLVSFFDTRQHPAKKPLKK